MRIGCQTVKEGTLEALYLGDFQKFEDANTDEERANAIKLMSISGICLLLLASLCRYDTSVNF